jgi:histidinol-phosphate aminotransferase
VGAVPVIAPDKDYATDVDAILACVTDRTRIIYVANPNNPTGTFTPLAEIARLHAALPSHILLVLDHAYAEYITGEEDDGGLELARTASNVLVTRTFSKIYGLAGERIGWGYGSPAIVDAMHRIRLPFSITIAGQNAAIAAIADQAFVDNSRAHNETWRSWLANEVASLGNAGLRAIPSKANFLLVLFEGALSAETTYKALMEHGYIVRWLPNQGLGNGLRITIGTEEEMRGLASALRSIVEAAI